MSETDIIYADNLGDPYSGITVLHLNNKVSKLNLIDKRFVAQIESVLKDIKHKNVTKVLIIQSDIDGVFCAGADLKERLQLNSQQIIDFVDSIRDVTTSIMKMPFPTIAAIDGHAIGGGLEISLCFDIRVIASNAKIGLPETKWAIIPGCKGTQLLPRLIPSHYAKEIIFTGQLYQGELVKSLGIANHYVEQNERGDAAYCKALEIAKSIAENNALAVQSAKLSINHGIETNIEHGLELERLYHSRLIVDSDDMRARIRSKLCTEKNS